MSIVFPAFPIGDGKGVCRTGHGNLVQCAAGRRQQPLREAYLAIGRVIAPLALAAAAFLFRRQIVDWIESLSGLGFVFTVVHLYSTAAARLIVGLLAFALFAAIGTALFRHASRRARVVLFASLCAILVAGCR